MVLIRKGAEADLHLEQWHGHKVVMKRRLPKAYRLPQLDLAVRTQRTLREPALIHRAKEAGVPTPTIYMIDLAESNIIMEYVEGKQVKQVLNTLPPEEKLRLCRHIGTLIGRLHKHGIIHGDLTTSNMILTSYRKIYLVDFGLGEHSEELEIRGVDLHLMKRALQSTHHRLAKKCFEAVTTGYTETVGKETAAKVLAKIQEIERRGRYIEER
ncbi:MAG TPA: KEOPS complex kinase/ATPase Bud32 [Candidatus Bathyarchaeia archaeon]|nr:KEOPS complex kinase/ATPase Bud32 [Candidatus Bathyarchaeia archaeon]